MDISIKIEGLNQYYGRKQALKDVIFISRRACSDCLEGMGQERRPL